MALLDLLGRRWTMRIIWELREHALTFRELQERCDNMSPTVLNQRLKELRESAILEMPEQGGYALSRTGMQLHEAMLPLLKWSEGWHKKLAAGE